MLRIWTFYFDTPFNYETNFQFFSRIIDCEVYVVGYEAIHVLNGSKGTTVESCFVHDTGLIKPGFGEGIYIGSDKSQWNKYDRDVSDTTVRLCTIGPNVRAEAFDIKEGTSETIIEYNTVDATGITGKSYTIHHYLIKIHFQYSNKGVTIHCCFLKLFEVIIMPIPSLT